MPIKSRWQIPIPTTSVPSFLFTSPTAPLSKEPILIDANQPETHYFSLHAFREWSKRFAAGLIAAGLSSGDRVVLFSGNTLFYPVVPMGVIMAGGIFSSANPAYTPRELAFQLQNANASFLLFARSNMEIAMKAAELAGLTKEQIFIFEDVPLDENVTAQDASSNDGKVSPRHWKCLLAPPEVGKAFEWETLSTVEHVNRTAILIYSSGTTGLPKGVELTHYGIVANVRQLFHIHNLDEQFAASSHPKVLGFLPMYHALGLIYYGFVALKRGLQVYVMQRYELYEAMKNIQRFKITELIMVPPMLVGMAKAPRSKNQQYDFSSVNKILCGAAPSGVEVAKLFEELIPNDSIKVRQAWGMSEAPAIVLTWDYRDTTTPSSISVGELLPNAEAKIMDDEGLNEVPVGERGELWIRSPNVMKNYWRNEKASKDTITADRWLKSGDIGFIDETNKIYIVDRKKELIKVRGNQVAPAELEALLLEHPGIADTAVIGISRDEDEYPRAYVVPVAGAVLTEEEVVKFIEERVTKVKRLTGGVRFIEAIPKNPSGKILRRQLRDIAAIELKSQQGRSSKL